MAASVEPRPSASPSGDWTVQVTDTITSVVGSIRDKTTVPAETVARGVVYGVLILAAATTAAVLLLVAVVRILAIWLPVWVTYVGLGGLFSLVGLLLWRKRRAPGEKG
ncbi:MAG TPA: hypothetical protein VHN98_03485 [Acidimicrobiales bacterium]|nr:hypothetical protein [Acidimicrobiales bacterium]